MASGLDVPNGDSARRRVRDVLAHVADVVVATLKLLKFPLSVFLALFITVSLAVGSMNIVVGIVQASFPAPKLPSLCELPFLSPTFLCGSKWLPSESTSTLKRADFPTLIRLQDAALDQLLDRSIAGNALALNVKHAELAVKDLVVAVRASNLTIKMVLADALSNFAVDAHSAGRSLQKVSAKMHLAIDSIASLNAYAYRAIDVATQRGSAHVELAVRRTFEVSLDGISSQITRVIVEATAAMATLDRLEDRLFDIHALCVPEAFAADVELNDLLWAIWTILGGNQDQLRDLRHRAAVLREVEQYRALALAHVSAAAQTLLAVEAELSGLRDRLTEVTVDPHNIPVEVHLASIERGVRRVEEVVRARNHVTGPD